MIIAVHNINKKVGYGASMTVLAVFVPIIWVIVIGLNKQPWDDNLGAPRIDQPDFTPATNTQPGASQQPSVMVGGQPTPAPVGQPQSPFIGQPQTTQIPSTEPVIDQNTPVEVSQTPEISAEQPIEPTNDNSSENPSPENNN